MSSFSLWDDDDDDDVVAVATNEGEENRTLIRSSNCSSRNSSDCSPEPQILMTFQNDNEEEGKYNGSRNILLSLIEWDDWQQLSCFLMHSDNDQKMNNNNNNNK